MVTTLHIDGMRSVHCARAVHTSLTQVEGIATAEVVVGKVVLDHQVTLDERALTVAIESVGYTVRELTTERRRLPLRETGAEEAE